MALCSWPKVPRMASKDCCTSAEICARAAISPRAASTLPAIADFTWRNCSEVSLILVKDPSRFSSLSWKWSAFSSTPEKDAPTCRSSQREVTSWLTSSFWYSFRLSDTCSRG